MIVTVTPNVAVDLTYEVEAVRVGQPHHVRRVQERAGGKGVNVARILAERGRSVTVTGFVGGDTGRRVRARVAHDGLGDAFLDVASESRRTVTVVDARGRATVFNEPGPVVTPAEWSRLVARVGDLLGQSTALVCSGSLPPGAPLDGYEQLVKLAVQCGIPSVVDATGEPLRRALVAGPNVVKPNAEELRATTGLEDPCAAVSALREAGARAVVASFGPLGLLAATEDAAWRAAPPRPVTGNPTGAGDAVTAALAAGLVDGRSWPEVLCEAIALAAGATAAPVAGAVDAAVYRTQLPDVEVTPIQDLASYRLAH